MKKKITRLYYFFWAMLAGYLFLSFSSNPPNGYTGAPPTFNTCSSASGGCHSGGSGTGSVSITGLPSRVNCNVEQASELVVSKQLTHKNKRRILQALDRSECTGYLKVGIGGCHE